MKKESNRNGKFKQWRDVRVIENESICKNLILHIQFYKIYFQFWKYFAQCLSVFTIEFGQINIGWKGQVKWEIYVFFIFILLVRLFRPSLFRVVLFSIFQFTEAVTGGALLKKVFSKISQISQESTCFGVSLIKLQAQACNFIKKRLHHRCFPAKYTKFLRTTILKNICERLLLNLSGYSTFFLEAILKKHTNGKTSFQESKEYNQKQHFEW